MAVLAGVFIFIQIKTEARPNLSTRRGCEKLNAECEHPGIGFTWYKKRGKPPAVYGLTPWGEKLVRALSDGKP